MISIIRLEIKRLLRDKRVLYFLIFLSIFASLSIPKRDSIYSVININGSTGTPDIYWITTITFIISNVFMLFAGFYIFRGYIRKDLKDGKSQCIYLTAVSIIKYIAQKFISILVVYLLSILVNIIIIFILNLSINNSVYIDSLYIIEMVFYIQIPFYILACTYITIFDLIPLLSSPIGGVIYFFISLVHLSNVWELKNFDITGLKILISTIRTYFPDGKFGVSIISNHSVVKYFDFYGIVFTSEYLFTQYIFTFITLIILLLITVIYAKYYKQIELSNIVHNTKDISYNNISNKSVSNVINKTVLRIKNEYIRIVFFELFILLRNKKRTIVVYIILLILAVSTKDMYMKFVYFSMFPIFVLGTFSEYKNKINGTGFSNIKLTILGYKYHFICISVIMALVTSMIIPILLFNFIKFNISNLLCNISGIIVFSCLIALWTYVFPRAFDVLYILFWYTAMFQKIIYIDIFALNKETIAHNQLVLNLSYITILVVVLFGTLVTIGLKNNKRLTLIKSLSDIR